MNVYIYKEQLIKEQTFTLSDFSAGWWSTRYDNIAVNWDIVEIEFNWTMNCPSSSSTWADAQIGFTQSNSWDWFPGMYKTRQIWNNRSYYWDQRNDFSLSLSGSDYLNALSQKTPAATWSYAIKIVVNSEWAVIESWTNTINHSWTSNESTRYNTIISWVQYCKIYWTQMSWTNMTVKVKYV